MSLVGGLAALYPWEVSVGEDLARAVRFLGWECEPTGLVRAGYGLGLVVGLLTALLVPLTPGRYRLAVGLGGVAGALAAVHAVHAGPRWLATARRTNALGTAPELLVLAVLRMRLSPSPERAAAFAAETGTGLLAESLAAHVRRARGTPRTGLGTFGEEWDEWFPSLGRGFGLVTAAGDVPASERARTLDRAMAVVLDGTRHQMQSFAGSVRGPATALYAFGVLLPTALVALLPAARAAGLAITFPVVVAIYDVALPLVLLVAGAWLLARRPVAFPPPDVPPDHPDVADRRVLAPLGGLVAAILAGAGAVLWFPGWGPPLAAAGLGLGAFLTIRYRPYVAVYEDVRAVERGLTDGLSLVGRRVAHGDAVEAAIAETAATLDGPTGDVLARGARQGRQLDVGVRRAFLGEHGALRTVPSPRVRGSVELLALAAAEGEPVGEAVLSTAGHLDDLRTVERDARENVRQVVETLRSTGALFGPLVGGATVALAGHMSAGGEVLPGGGGPMPWLGLAVGGYVLVLAAILTALATGLERGLDRQLLGYRVGLALCLATATYHVGYLAGAVVA